MVFLFISCGTRKKQLQVETTKTGVNLKEQLAITTNVKKTKTNTSTIYTPIDPTKPMTLPDGRTSTNAIIEEKDEAEQSETNVLDNSKKQMEVKEESKKKDLDVQTKKANPYLWLAIAVSICFAMYFAHRWIKTN